MTHRTLLSTLSRALGPTALAALLVLPACGGLPKRWAALEVSDIQFMSVYLGVIDTLDSLGYEVMRREPDKGRIESEWLYGTSVREVYGPSRRKVIVEILPGERVEFETLIVQVRVKEEVIRKAGPRAVNVRESDDWEEWKDNFDDAEFVAAKVRALLSDYVVNSGSMMAGEG